ncbi:MAG: hypothetical protein ACTSP9_16330 [Promethearchaeota archaeon]
MIKHKGTIQTMPGRKSYKSEKPMSILAIIGAILSLISLILAITGFPNVNMVIRIPATEEISDIVIFTIGIIISTFTLVYSVQNFLDKKLIPLGYSAGLVIIIGIAQIIFGGALIVMDIFFIPGILVVIAGFILLFGGK